MRRSLIKINLFIISYITGIASPLKLVRCLTNVNANSPTFSNQSHHINIVIHMQRLAIYKRICLRQIRFGQICHCERFSFYVYFKQESLLTYIIIVICSSEDQQIYIFYIVKTGTWPFEVDCIMLVLIIFCWQRYYTNFSIPKMSFKFV